MASERGKAGFMSEWTSACGRKMEDCEGKIGQIRQQAAVRGRF